MAINCSLMPSAGTRSPVITLQACYTCHGTTESSRYSLQLFTRLKLCYMYMHCIIYACVHIYSVLYYMAALACYTCHGNTESSLYSLQLFTRLAPQKVMLYLYTDSTVYACVHIECFTVQCMCTYTYIVFYSTVHVHIYSILQYSACAHI